MSLAIYPGFLSATGRGLTFTLMRTPEMSTTVQDAPNGLQVRIQNWQNPKLHWTLIYDYLRSDPSNLPPPPFNTYTDFQQLLGFFNGHYGMGASFLFNDSTLNSIGPGAPGGVPNTYAELQLVNDGAGTYFAPIQIHVGGQSGTDQTYGFFWDVTDLQPSGGADHSALSVYANGSLLTYGTDFVLAGPGLAVPGASFQGLYLAFTSMPTAPITITCNFYWRVIFETDQIDFEQFLALMYTIGGSGAKNGSGQVKFVTAWPPSV
jgi:hypothetical protein